MAKSKWLSIPLIIFTVLLSLSTCDSVVDFLNGLDSGLLSDEGLIPSGTAFFVGENGNDDHNDGLSAANPFKTFDKALNAAIASSTVKRVAVIGTLTASESQSSDSDSTFLIAATPSDEITIIGYGDNAVLAAAIGKRVLVLPNGSNTSVPIVFSNITLSGGSLSDSGAGLYIGTNRKVTLKSDVTITGCDSTGGYGGGVAVFGTFMMNGGNIQDNSATSGGGVYVAGGDFAMTAGSISYNTATDWGGGIEYDANSSMVVRNALIANNTAGKGGGGIDARIVTVIDSVISDNHQTNTPADASDGGGGIRSKGVCRINNTLISGNTATGRGGGVLFWKDDGILSPQSIKKTGGIIYGKDGGDNANLASADSNGHAVYDTGHSRFRDNTANADVALDSDNAASGWGI